MKIKRNTALAGFGLALGAVLVLTQPGWAGPKCFKLEGAWIGKVPTLPVTWSYSVSPDPAGQTASMSGSVQVPIQPFLLTPDHSDPFPGVEYISPMVGNVRMTGQGTLEGTIVWYGMKKGVPFNQVVYIGLNNAQARFLDSGHMIMTNNLAFYAPSTDADEDGLPDPGTAPTVYSPPTVSLETRVPIVPPYTP